MEDKQYQIFISPLAAQKVKEQLDKRGTPNAYLRLGVRGSGCSGFSYVLQFDDSLKSTDLIFTLNEVSILVDKKSIIYLNGSTLDWEQTLIKHGFKFVNPQEKSRCGCGESFSVGDK